MRILWLSGSLVPALTFLPGWPLVKPWLRRLLIPEDDTLPPLAYWRERVLRATLLGTAVGAVVPYLLAVIYGMEAGQHLMVAVDTAAYLMVIVMAVRPDLPFGLRAGVLVAVPLVIAVVLLTDAASVTAGAAWLTAFPVLAALFFGLRAAAVALGVQVVVVGAVGLAVYTGRLDWGGALAPFPQGALATWLITGTNVLLLSTILSVCGGVLLRALERTAEQEARARKDLLREIEGRKDLEARLRQSEKLEAMGTLAGGIAHDFNNLLVPILLRSREVIDALPRGHEAREVLNDVILSATRARDMVRRILTFSRGGEAEPRPVLVDEAVDEVASLLRNTLPATIRLEVEPGAPRVRVLTDPSELHQVIMNLGTNSYHAMKETGGVLRLATWTDGGLEEDRREVVLEVADTGVGMPQKTLDRIFEPFFTTRERGEGTGLGIPTVHRIVVGLGGSLDIETEEGEGTRVRVTLPVLGMDQEAAKDSEARPEAEDPDGLPEGEPSQGFAPGAGGERRPLRVALVDDEAAVLRATQALLARLGFQVTAFPVPEAALRHLSDLEHRVDLLLTDYIMPGMTGLELAREARKVRPDLPVILSSGNLDEPVEERLSEAGISGVLPKPWDAAELMATVRSVLG